MAQRYDDMYKTAEAVSAGSRTSMQHQLVSQPQKFHQARMERRWTGLQYGYIVYGLAAAALVATIYAVTLMAPKPGV
jgi:hypothetical protein